MSHSYRLFASLILLACLACSVPVSAQQLSPGGDKIIENPASTEQASASGLPNQTKQNQSTKSKTEEENKQDGPPQTADTKAGNKSDSKKQPLFKRMAKRAAIWNLEYYFVAQNWKNCDLFTGLVRHNILIGGATVHFFFPDGVECTGKTQIVYTPPGGGPAGQQGRVSAEGSDGRQIRGTFTCHSVTTGSGNARDSKGNQYEFTFGHSAKQAVQRANELRRTLGCDEITVSGGTQLEVQGKVLRLE